MSAWEVERVVHFAPGDFVVEDVAHFGFHVGDRYYGIAHPRHFLGLVGAAGALEWTVARHQVADGVPNIAVDLDYPMYVDELPDRTLLVSNMGNARLYRVDPSAQTARLLVDGRRLGMVDMGNCVVDGQGCIWVNEVTGCRIWRFDDDGGVVETLGDGVAGFQQDPTPFGLARFGWVYDIRRGVDGSLFVLDSGNFAVRVIDLKVREARTVAGDGTPGPALERVPAREARFGSDREAQFDGPMSLSVDDAGQVYVGDRVNHVVRAIDPDSGVISTIAGRPGASGTSHNDPGARDPRALALPMITSMDYHDGRLYVPTDLADGCGDLVVMVRA